MPIGPQDPTNGVLDLPKALRAFRLDRHAPAADLTPWVDSYWEVVWDLPPGTVHRQTNLSHATINVAVEPEGWLYGVPGPTFVRELSGQGRVFGIKFLPGAFFPWARGPLKPLFDRRVPLVDLWGNEGEAWASRIADEPDFGRRAALADAFLLTRRPGPPGEGRRCCRTLVENRSLLSVSGACRLLGHDARSLQRLFEREVGVGPKEVLRRYRLMEAAERLVRESALTGADLATSLGYADQAHFIRDFKAVTGVPPEAYRRRQDH